MGDKQKPSKENNDLVKKHFDKGQADKDWDERKDKGSVVDKKFGDKKQ